MLRPCAMIDIESVRLALLCLVVAAWRLEEAQAHQ